MVRPNFITGDTVERDFIEEALEAADAETVDGWTQAESDDDLAPSSEAVLSVPHTRRIKVLAGQGSAWACSIPFVIAST